MCMWSVKYHLLDWCILVDLVVETTSTRDDIFQIITGMCFLQLCLFSFPCSVLFFYLHYSLRVYSLLFLNFDHLIQYLLFCTTGDRS